MTKINAVLLIVGLLVSTGASAEDMTTKGVPSCGDWVKNRTEQGWRGVADMNWFWGYLTGLAMVSDKNFLKGTDNASLLLWMDNYCKANPLENVAYGGASLAGELIQRSDKK